MRKEYPKKIVIDGFVHGRQMTGLERHLRNAIDVMKSLAYAYEVELLLASSSKSARDEGIRVLKVPKTTLKILYFIIASHYIEKCDTYIGFSGLLPLFLKKKARNRFVFVHDLFWHENRYQSLKHYVYFILHWLSIRNATKVIAISKETKRKLQFQFPEIRNIKIIENYIEFKRLEIKMTPSDGRQKMLSVGLNSQRKSPRLCFEVARYMHEHYGFEWHVVGLTCEIENYLLSYGIDLRSTTFVKLHTGISDCELASLYTECRYTLILSEDEGFCYPVVEAQARGSIPIVSEIEILRDVGGPEVFTHCSVKLSLNDITNRLEFLEKCKSLRCRLRERGLKNVKRYSSDECSKAFETELIIC